jgi:hypothetical protein
VIPGSGRQTGIANIFLFSRNRMAQKERKNRVGWHGMMRRSVGIAGTRPASGSCRGWSDAGSSGEKDKSCSGNGLALVSKIVQIRSMPTTLSISEAKQRLGEIADRAIQGEQIVIIRKSRLLVLKELEIPEPVPMRSLGHFEDYYDKTLAGESNRLASRSVRKVVK